MESEKLKEIYKELKSFCKENNIETGKSGYLMGLFTKYHRALSQHDVIKNEVAVCDCDEEHICGICYKSKGYDLVDGRLKQTVL